MAPITSEPGALAKLLDQEIPEVITRYDKLWEVEDPEDNPYKSKYEARKLLENVAGRVEQLLETCPDSEDTDRGSEMLARLFLFLGKNYYYCEEVATAEKFFNRSLERYLRSPLRLDPKAFVYIQDVLNQLGMLWCNRQSHSEGMNFLRRAQIMFVNRPPAVREAVEERAADNFTLTMFYLAQAYGALQKPTLSARFCAATVARQLEHNTSGRRDKEMSERDPFDCKDWVRNCCSLSDYFINEGMFWTAEYLLHAASLMCQRCKQICGFRPEGIDELSNECLRDLGNFYSARLKFMRTCAENPEHGEEIWRGERKKAKGTEDSNGGYEGSRLTFRCAADGAAERPPEGGCGPILWDAVFPEVVHLEDEEAHDNRLAEEEETQAADACSQRAPGDAAKSAGEDSRCDGWLALGPGQRVRLPVVFRRLHEVVERRVRRANAPFLECRGLPPTESHGAVGSTSPPEGSDAELPPRLPSCIGSTFETAREVFKLANYYHCRALGYFLLDGWVTEHVRILQELSQMYRSLLYWEKDHKRAAVMMSRRVKMLAPLLEVLNPKVYVAFWRQLSFEVAEVFQELYELKANGVLPGGRKPSPLDEEPDEDENDAASQTRKVARCNEMARKAVKYYGTFIDSYHPDGKPPERIDDDNCRTYLIARLNRARMRTKGRGIPLDDQVEEHRLALREYEWILDYGKRHPEVLTKPEINMATEMKLCEEMAGMLPSKLSQLAAKRGSR